MAYFLAPSLVSLRNEVNAAHPNRDKTSDGWIGDASHAARKSDHNPDYAAGGIVRAIDIDRDGIDTAKLLRVACANSATEYVIFERKIYTRQNGFRPQAYTGTNPHDKHMHISNRHGAAYETARNWGYAAAAATSKPPAGRESVAVIAAQVIAGRWGSGTDRTTRLRAAGYDPAVVQAEVNRRLSGGTTPAPTPAKSITTIAQEVIAGDWGNGVERSRRLLAAGHSPTQVQNEVNRLLGGGGTAPTRLSVSTLAEQVIRGQWGSGPERVQRLTAAGYDPAAVQAEVNRRL